MRVPRLLDDEGLNPSQLLELLERTNTGVFFWDALDDFVEWSAGIFRALGYDSPEDASYDDFESLLHPDDRSHLSAAVVRTRAETGEYAMELRLKDAEGNFKPFRAFGKWFRTGEDEFLIGFINDISELAEARDRADRSMQMLKAFFDNAPAAVSIQNQAGRYLYGNQFAARLAGCELDDLLSRPASDLLGAEIDGETKAANRKVFEEGKVVTSTGEVGTPSGESFHVFDTRFPISDPKTGEPLLGVFGIDVTGQHQMEQALAESKRLEALGQLVSGIAHDFNNSLSIMQGSLDLIELADSQEELVQYCSDLQGGIERGMRLTRELLTYGRKALLENQLFNLNTVLDAMDLLLRRALPENIEVEISLADDLRNVMVDRSQFENAVLNLALNAKDAMPEGGSLTIETANFQISDAYVASRQESIDPGDYVLVTVTDTGIGMDENILAQAFDPFFTTKPADAGTGMGLTTVDGFVRQLGGVTQIDSELGAGTTVKLFFPAADGEPAPERAPLRQRLVRGSERVLVVEDHASVRRLLSRKLNKLGYEVVEAANGAEALEIFRDDPALDLVITDVVMPGRIQGPMLVRKIRELTPGFPVLFISGYPLDAANNGGVPDDRDKVLMKPVAMDDLATSVRACIDGRGDR